METTIVKKGRPQGVLNPKPKPVKDYNYYLREEYRKGNIDKEYLELYTNSTKKRVPPQVEMTYKEIRDFLRQYSVKSLLKAGQIPF